MTYLFRQKKRPSSQNSNFRNQSSSSSSSSSDDTFLDSDCYVDFGSGFLELWEGSEYSPDRLPVAGNWPSMMEKTYHPSYPSAMTISRRSDLSGSDSREWQVGYWSPVLLCLPFLLLSFASLSAAPFSNAS